MSTGWKTLTGSSNLKNLIIKTIFLVFIISSNLPSWVLFDSSKLQKQAPEVFCKKGVLRNFAKFTGKHLCQSLFFNKVAGLRPVFMWILRNFLEQLFYRTPLVAASETYYQQSFLGINSLPNISISLRSSCPDVFC